MRRTLPAWAVLSFASAIAFASGATAEDVPAVGATSPSLALVIDDLGYNLERGRRAIGLRGPITVAVLPFAPHSTRLAQIASGAGADVLLHEPMQALDSVAAPGLLTAAMSDDALRDAFERALATVPHAVGVSNHTGSLLTALPAPMRSLMRDVRAHGLFFLDSRTTPATIARDIAIEAGVPAVRRDVFLDHTVDPRDIANEFERAIAIAEREGHAVLIAHPYDESLEFLEAALPTLASRGIEQIALARLAAAVSPATTPGRNEIPASPRTAPAL